MIMIIYWVVVRIYMCLITWMPSIYEARYVYCNMFTLACLPHIYFPNINALLTQPFLSYHKIDIFCPVTSYKHAKMGPYWLYCNICMYLNSICFNSVPLEQVNVFRSCTSFTFSHWLHKFIYRFWTFSFYVSHCCCIESGRFPFSDPLSSRRDSFLNLIYVSFHNSITKMYFEKYLYINYVFSIITALVVLQSLCLLICEWLWQIHDRPNFLFFLFNSWPISLAWKCVPFITSFCVGLHIHV
jgi:hypothetical protein